MIPQVKSRSQEEELTPQELAATLVKGHAAYSFLAGQFLLILRPILAMLGVPSSILPAEKLSGWHEDAHRAPDREPRS